MSAILYAMYAFASFMKVSSVVASICHSEVLSGDETMITSQTY